MVFSHILRAIFCQVHATQQPTLSICLWVDLMVTLGFFSSFYAILRHFELFKVNSSQFTFGLLVFGSFGLLVATGHNAQPGRVK